MLLLGWESCILVNTQIISPDFTLQAETSQLEGLNTITVITEPLTIVCGFDLPVDKWITSANGNAQEGVLGIYS